MTPLGWLIMCVSLSSVIGLTAFCLWRVANLPPAEIDDAHAPGDAEFSDRDQQQ
jgi:hypothetical protein